MHVCILRHLNYSVDFLVLWTLRYLNTTVTECLVLIWTLVCSSECLLHDANCCSLGKSKICSVKVSKKRKNWWVRVTHMGGSDPWTTRPARRPWLSLLLDLVYIPWSYSCVVTCGRAASIWPSRVGRRCLLAPRNCDWQPQAARRGEWCRIEDKGKESERVVGRWWRDDVTCVRCLLTLLRAVTLIIWLCNTVLCLSTDGRRKRLLDRQCHATTNTVDTVGCRRDTNDHRNIGLHFRLSQTPKRHNCVWDHVSTPYA